MTITLDLSRKPDQPPGRPSLAGMPLPALKAELEAMGLDPKKASMRAKQISRWSQYFGATSFEGMTDIGKELRAELAARFTLDRPEIADHQAEAILYAS